MSELIVFAPFLLILPVCPLQKGPVLPPIHRMALSLPTLLKVLLNRLCPVLFVMLVPFAPRVHAGSAAWDTSPTSNDWNTAVNWTPDVVPNGAADVASFGSSNVTSISLSSDVQLAGMTFNSGASAFTISKQNISISGGITNNSTSAQTFTSALTLTGNQTFTAGSANLQFGSAVGAGDGAINLQGVTLTTSGNNLGNSIFNGIISGTGGLRVNLPNGEGGRTFLNAANTFSGGVALGGGPLYLNNAAALGTGALTIVNSNAAFSNTSGAPVILNNNALNLSGGSPDFFGLNDLSFGTGPVTLTGSAGNNRTITTDWETTTLTLNGVMSDAGSNMGLTKDGAGILALGGENTFTHFVRIQYGTLSVSHIGNAGLSSNLGTNGTINFGSTSTPGGPGILRYTGTGETSDKVLNLSSNSGGAVIDQSGSGLLKFTSALTATGAGSKSLTLRGSTSGTGEIAGAIVNNSATNRTSLVKDGTGTWTLSGANSYTGATTVNSGTLRVNGSITSSVTVFGPGPFGGVGGTLAGSGTTGAVTVNVGGTLSPGNSPGILNVQGNLSLAMGATYLVDLNGNAVGTGYDQTNVTGSLALGNATLSLALGFSPANGSQFVIINNDGTDPASGTFNNLGEGSTINAGGQTFVISYAGGDGNDVVLTAVPEPATWALLLSASAVFAVSRKRR
jgi:fibronectin-binding autotransporter adhesin